jgi:hypothetical protein
VVVEDSEQLSTGDGKDIAKIMSQLLWRFADVLAAAIPKGSALAENHSLDTNITEIETTKN